MKRILHLAALAFLVTSVSGVATAGETNYFCILCGKGPLEGRIWISKWGPVCDDCYQLPNHCSLCGLSVRAGDGSVKTGDGRFICKFDQPNAVLDAAGAREVFLQSRRELIGLFGRGFALNYPDVTVNVFDVDYWSEAGRPEGLHKFGFAHTRKTPGGDCTHEVVMLSGRLRTELAATAAHEYTHLWINENRPEGHVIDSDTTEAICELAAYKLAQARAQPQLMEEILANPYTHGEIKKMVALESAKGMGYILNWVRNGTTATLPTASTGLSPASQNRSATLTNVPSPLPKTIKLDSLLTVGPSRLAIINGVSFATDDLKRVILSDRAVEVRCREIRYTEVVLELAGKPEPVTLKLGEQKIVP